MLRNNDQLRAEFTDRMNEFLDINPVSSLVIEINARKRWTQNRKSVLMKNMKWLQILFIEQDTLKMK